MDPARQEENTDKNFRIENTKRSFLITSKNTGHWHLRSVGLRSNHPGSDPASRDPGPSARGRTPMNAWAAMLTCAVFT